MKSSLTVASLKSSSNDHPFGENQIVVYQPDATVRLDVRLENETVWLTQGQMAELFGCSADNVGLHLKNIYAAGELERSATTEDFSVVRTEGGRRVCRTVMCYNLDAIISVGYRVNSILGVRFRQWASKILKDYLLRGISVNARLNQLEDKVDRRMASHDERIALLEGKVDFFVQTQTPPLQGVFYDGQLWDARAFADRLISSAKKSIILIDNWATLETLDILATKRNGVALSVVTSGHLDRKGCPRPKILPADIAKFNAQYPLLDVRFSERFHDRFLVLDDKDIYLIGASLKDLGRKCFAFTKLDSSSIPGIKARI